MKEKNQRVRVVDYCDEIVENLVKVIDRLDGFELIEAFDDVDYPIGSVLHLSIGKDKAPLTYQNMGATIIDAVLQAGVNYERAVRPRVEDFRSRFPQCKTTKDFLRIIAEIPVSELINWQGVKAERIVKLTEFLNTNNIQTESEMLDWLKSPANCALIQGIKGIKQKTTDYLKILGGEQETVAVDTHLRNFIAIYGGHSGTLEYEEGKSILIATAQKLNITASKLDHSIWKFMSTRKK